MNKMELFYKFIGICHYLVALFFFCLGIFLVGYGLSFEIETHPITRAFWTSVGVFSWGVALLLAGFLVGAFEWND
jgi:hypothetical protein